MATQLTDPLPGIEARPDGAHYAILDQGAHVLAWQPAGQRPVLWVSALSEFRPGKAVRGGVPVIFPWFAKGWPGRDRPTAHGYARVVDWHREEAAEQGDQLRVSYRLDARDGFPGARLTATFGPEQFEVALTITNDTHQPATVEAALHTYFAVGDIRQASLDGFDGTSYIDTVTGRDPGPHVQHGSVTFAAETDRICQHEGSAVLHDPVWGRTITVAKTGSADTVVWNPWTERAAAMADFGDDEWQQMVCIEAANVRDNAIELAPGAAHTMSQVIGVSDRQAAEGR